MAQTQNPGAILIENLRSFLHLTTQAPLEYVCKSALYLLTHVPATRAAVFEYIGTFYKVATFLHIRFNLNQKNPNWDQTSDTQNINHINQVLDLIEESLAGLILSDSDSDIWSLEISQWLIDLIGDIINNNGVSFTDSTGLSIEESNAFKSMSIIDALEFWSNQCKPTKNILELIRKCLRRANNTSKSAIVDLIFNASNKYSTVFDWILIDMAALEPEIIFSKCLKNGYKEFLTLFGGLASESVNEQKFSRINVIGFYALNFSSIVKNELIFLIEECNRENESTRKTFLVYLLKMSSQSSSLINLLLNEMLSENSDHGTKLKEFFISCIENEPDNKLTINLNNCIKQLSNSIAVFDLISSLVEWLNSNKKFQEDQLNKSIYYLIKAFLDELELLVYSINSTFVEQPDKSSITIDTIPFLKNLNTINNSSFKHLLDQIISVIKAENLRQAFFQENKNIMFKLLVILANNGNDYIANLIMYELMLVSNNLDDENKDVDYYKCPIILKYRQETSPFHTFCLRDTIKSLSNSFSSEFENENFRSFIENAILIYEWDLKNKEFINESISFILIDRECFVSLINQLAVENYIKSNSSYYIIELYKRILMSNEENLPYLKLNISDLLLFSTKSIDHFFMLFSLMNEDNISDLTEEINSLNELIKYSLLHLSYFNEEKSPFRNILLRTLIDKLFELTKNNNFLKLNENEKKDSEIIDSFNLFNSNLILTNTELNLQKNRFKTFKNTLADFSKKKSAAVTCQMHQKYMAMMCFAFCRLLETICSRCLENTEIFSNFEEKKSPFKTEIKLLNSENENNLNLLTEPMCNLADILVQHILLDKHFIDYQWTTAVLNENDDNFDAEVEAIKLYIERDVSVQNAFENFNNNKINWMILDFLTLNEQAFFKAAPLVRSLLASVIIQWDNVQEQACKNVPKTFEITMKLLNILNKVPNLLPKPLCYIVEIVSYLNSYETHIVLLLIWKYLKAKMQPNNKSNFKPAIDLKHLRFIFQKNISKIDFLYAKFFKN